MIETSNLLFTGNSVGSDSITGKVVLFDLRDGTVIVPAQATDDNKRLVYARGGIGIDERETFFFGSSAP